VSSSPAALAAGHLLALAGTEPAPADAARSELLEALSQVPDPRDPRGVRYAFVPVLAVAVCATLAGARSYSAISEWASDAPPELRALLGLPGPVPDLVTIWRVLTAVDPAALDKAIGAWVTAQLTAGQSRQARAVLAVDGKTVRGARSEARSPRRTSWPAWTTRPAWSARRSPWTARPARSLHNRPTNPVAHAHRLRE
jgi:hypothetical protein